MNNDLKTIPDGKSGFPVGGRHAHFILITCSLLYMINCIDRQVLSVVMEPMKVEMGLSDALLGTLQTVFLLSIALLAYPISFLMDRWSRKKAVSLMALVWSIFTLVTGLGRSFIGVLIPRTLVAAGESGFSAGGTALIGAAYPHRSRARALGIFNATIPLGMGLGVILGGMISAKYGWRVPFFMFAVPGIILGLVALFMKDYKTTEDLDEAGRKKGFFRAGVSLFQIPTLRWTYLGNAMQNITAYSFLTWAPAFVMRAQSIEEDKAGLLIGTLSLMAIVGAPLGGIIADLWQKKNPRGRVLTPVFTLSLTFIFYILAVYYELDGIGLVFGFALGIFLVMGLASFAAITQDVVTPAQKSMAWGMNSFAMYVLGGGWGPLVVGLLSDSLNRPDDPAFGLKYALIIASVGSILGALCLLIASRHYQADMEKVAAYELKGEE